MKYLSAVCLVSALCLSSCSSSPQANNHWHIDSVGPRIEKAFMGHQNADEFELARNVHADLGDIGVSLKRHLMHDNPSNPLLPQSSRPSPKPQLPDREFSTRTIK